MELDRRLTHHNRLRRNTRGADEILMLLHGIGLYPNSVTEHMTQKNLFDVKFQGKPGLRTAEQILAEMQRHYTFTYKNSYTSYITNRSGVIPWSVSFTLVGIPQYRLHILPKPPALSGLDNALAALARWARRQEFRQATRSIVVWQPMSLVVYGAYA